MFWWPCWRLLTSVAVMVFEVSSEVNSVSSIGFIMRPRVPAHPRSVKIVAVFCRVSRMGRVTWLVPLDRFR